MRHYLAIFTTIVIFSTIEVVTKEVAGIDPHLLAVLRFLPSGILLLLIGARNLRRLTWSDAAALAALGFVGITLTFSAYHTSLAVENFQASTAAVVFSINPVFCTLAASVFLGEKLTAPRTAGVLLGVAGVYIVSFGFEPIAFASAKAPALMFAAQVCFAIYIVLTKKYVAKYGPFCANGVIFVAGSLLLLPLVGRWEIPTDTWRLGCLAYLALVSSGLGYALYFYGLNRVSIAAGTSFFYLKPVLAPLLAYYVRHDTLELHFFIGLLIVLASLTLTVFGGRRAGTRRGSSQQLPSPT